MTGVVEVLGYEIGAIPAAVVFAVSAGGLILAAKVALSWLYGVAVSLALRHGIYAILTATGISIEALVEGGLREFLPAALSWIVEFLGVEIPFLATVAAVA